MAEPRNAETAAGQTVSEAFAIWCHQDALRTWKHPRHQEWHYNELIANEEVRLAFEAGAASRQGEVDHYRAQAEKHSAIGNRILDRLEAAVNPRANHADGCQWPDSCTCPLRHVIDGTDKAAFGEAGIVQ